MARWGQPRPEKPPRSQAKISGRARLLSNIRSETRAESMVLRAAPARSNPKGERSPEAETA
jgi:hypothetical protein